jgi:hypothetical protein
MTDILDEVLNDKKEERKVLLLKKALPIVGAITLLIIIIMLINNVRTSTKETYNLEMGDTLVKALENAQNDPKVAIEGIQYLMDHAENHVKDAAALQMIAMNFARGNFDEILSITTKIADDNNYLPLTQAYAKFMWISIVVDGDNSMKEKHSKQLTKYFAHFTDTATPFYGSSKLLEALYYKNTDKSQSIKILEALISGKNIAPTIREEARAAMANINAKQ